MLKTALAAVCALTLLATVYLSLSLVVLQPPRANYRAWFTIAPLLLAQGAITLAALTGILSARWLQWLALAGAVAATGAGAAAVYTTISGAHFEGYALVLGAALALQGALTLAYFLPHPVRPSSQAQA
jgi:hypothetical protein